MSRVDQARPPADPRPDVSGQPLTFLIKQGLASGMTMDELLEGTEPSSGELEEISKLINRHKQKEG